MNAVSKLTARCTEYELTATYCKLNAESKEDFDMNVEIAKIQHTDVTLEQPTSEQLSQIQSKTFDSMSDMKQYVQSVMNGELTQDEINAMLMLQIAELKAGVDSE